MQLAGLQRADRDAQLQAGDQVGDDHVLRAEAGGLHDGAAVILRGGAQQFDRGVELGGEVGAGARVQRRSRTPSAGACSDEKFELWSDMLMSGRLARANSGSGLRCTSPW